MKGIFFMLELSFFLFKRQLFTVSYGSNAESIHAHFDKVLYDRVYFNLCRHCTAKLLAVPTR